MKVRRAGFRFLDYTKDAVERIEAAARVCYRSEQGDKPTGELLRKLIARGHDAMLEHAGATVLFIVDRAIANEIVRHRVASYAQESTRYVSFEHGIEVIAPSYWKSQSEKHRMWLQLCKTSEMVYRDMISSGASPQEARGVLPLSLATRLVMSANMREWRHFLKLRTARAAHPQMREIALKVLEGFRRRLPLLVEDIDPDDNR